MIKECKIINYNKYTHIVIAEYDGTQIQFYSDKDSLDSVVYIKKESNHYTIVDKQEYDKSLKVAKIKKTTIKENEDLINKEALVD